MEALQFSLKDKTLKYGKIPRPTLKSDDDILIKVAYAGVCGTDLHIMQGEFACRSTRPVTLGHEFSGVVVEVGKAVTKFKAGDNVSVDPNNGCHCCHDCHSGNPHFCKDGGINNTIGIFRDGGFAEYVVAPLEQVHKLSATTTLEQAALCEPISCLSHGLDLANPIEMSNKILISGAGIIGNLWACALHLKGHRNVTISEPNASRLENLKALDLGFNLITPDQLKKNKAADKDYGFDVVIDCSGFPPAIEYAVTLLNFGGKLIIFGVAPPHGKISVSPFEIYDREIKIIGVKINPHSFPNSIAIVESMGPRYLTYSKLGVKIFALREYEQAIDALKKGSIAKAVFKL